MDWFWWIDFDGLILMDWLWWIDFDGLISMAQSWWLDLDGLIFKVWSSLFAFVHSCSLSFSLSLSFNLSRELLDQYLIGELPEEEHEKVDVRDELAFPDQTNMFVFAVPIVLGILAMVAWKYRHMFLESWPPRTFSSPVTITCSVFNSVVKGGRFVVLWFFVSIRDKA